MSGDMQFEWSKPEPVIKGYMVLSNKKFSMGRFRQDKSKCLKLMEEMKPYTNSALEVVPVRIIIQVGNSK